MADLGAEVSGSERVFRVGNRRLIFVLLFLAMLSILPAMSVHELLTTGTIDMDAAGQGRRKIPTWISYLVAWVCLLIVGWGFRPLFRYFRNREMFRLNGEGLVIGGETILREEVLGFRFTFLRGHVLQTTRGYFPIHPGMIRGAADALTNAFPHIPPLWKAPISPKRLGD